MKGKTCWAYARRVPGDRTLNGVMANDRYTANRWRSEDEDAGIVCGPVVSVTLPPPEPRKRVPRG